MLSAGIGWYSIPVTCTVPSVNFIINIRPMVELESFCTEQVINHNDNNIYARTHKTNIYSTTNSKNTTDALGVNLSKCY